MKEFIRVKNEKGVTNYNTSYYELEKVNDTNTYKLFVLTKEGRQIIDVIPEKVIEIVRR